MMSGISSALSGYNAAVTRLEVGANNIANLASTQSVGANGGTVNTPYVPEQVVQASVSGGGVTTTIQGVSPASIPQYDPSNPAANAQGIVQAPNVDLAGQLIDTKIASYDAQANLKVLKVQNDLLRQALNILS